MKKEHLQAGEMVDEGKYRCNGCAKELQIPARRGKLPQCSACGGFSWRRSGRGNKS